MQRELEANIIAGLGDIIQPSVIYEYLALGKILILSLFSSLSIYSI